MGLSNAVSVLPHFHTVPLLIFETWSNACSIFTANRSAP